MIDRFYCRKGDTARPYIVFLENTVRQPQILTGATVTFSMKAKGINGTTKVQDGECTVLDAAAGKVSYKFAGADVDTPGVYLGWFTVTLANGEEARFPAQAAPADYNHIIVQPTENS